MWSQWHHQRSNQTIENESDVNAMRGFGQGEEPHLISVNLWLKGSSFRHATVSAVDTAMVVGQSCCPKPNLLLNQNWRSAT
jgi:hypothetical protein